HPARPGERAFQVPLVFGTFECGLTLPPEGETGVGFPVLVCDARTGKLVQRLNLPAGVPRLWVGLGGREGADLRPGVAISQRGLVIVLSRRVWGLTAATDLAERNAGR